MYLGDYLKGAVVRFPWNTSGADGASITRGGNGTLHVYKDGDAATEVTTGITDTEDFDALTGVHSAAIDTANAFYAPGSEFAVVLKAATIDGKPVNAVLATFSIQRPTSLRPVVGTAQGGAAGYVDLPATASSTDGAYEGAAVVITAGTGAGQVRSRGAAYTGASRRFTVDPAFATAPDNTSVVEVHLQPPPRTTTPLPVNVVAMANDVITAAKLASDARQAIAQEVLLALVMGRGNKVEIVGSDIVLKDTDGTTVISTQPFTRLPSTANPIATVG